MSVPEIDKFRQKYPMYNDMDDLTVATKLAQKYPVYGDLPGKVSMERNKADPSMQGGANAPALESARSSVGQLTKQNQNLDTQVGINQAAYNYSWPVSLMMKKGLGDKGPNPVPDGGANKLLADAGAIANPATGEAFRLGGKAIGAVLKPFKDAAAQSKLLSQTAKEVGSASKSSDSIVRRMGELKDASITPLKDTIESEKSNFQDVKDSLQGQIENKRGLKSGSLEVTKEYQKAMKESVMGDLTKQKESLEEALQGEAEGVAKYMKDEIPARIRSMNDVFGKHIDDISDAMEKAGKGISQTDRFNILNATKEEADALGISTGRARNLLDKLHADASNTVEGKKVPLGILGADGKPIVSEVPGNGSEMIPFRDFIQETRQFRKILSDAKLTGVKGLNDEDIVGAIYNKNVNKYLEENVASYRSLQKDYAPVINAMKTARRIFKPGDIYSDEQGVNLLKRYASGKASEGKEQLFKDVQASSRFGVGSKDFTKNIKSIGDKLADVKSKISTMPKMLQDKFSKELATIADSHDKDIAGLQDSLDKSKDDSQMKIDSVKDKIKDIENHYDARIKQVRDTADKLKDFKGKARVTGLLGLVGLGEVGRKGQDLKHLIAAH